MDAGASPALPDPASGDGSAPVLTPGPASSHASESGPSASPNHAADTVCVSAPGKVLIAGGYLVLERQYEGLVLATSSRFYCVARSIPRKGPSGNEQESPDELSAIITVSAAQFPPECSWSYRVSISSDSSSLLPAAPNTSAAADKNTPAASTSRSAQPHFDLKQTNPDVGRNKFVEITVAKALQLAFEHVAAEEGRSAYMEGAARELLRRIRGKQRGDGLEAFVLADNDFYSQREALTERNLPRRTASLDAIPPFNPHSRPIHEINKTGLGSSAALVTSLTAALLAYLGVVSLPNSSVSSKPSSALPAESHTDPLDLVHALAQLSHCLAQGKVGSGFDVSSAVYGSHAYRRFSPAILAPLMAAPLLPIVPSGSLLPALSRQKWDQTTTPLRLPRGFRLVLADVDAGTDTPSFVNKVLWWRVEQADEAGEIWKRLDKANSLLGEHLREMCQLENEEGYDAFVAESAKVDMEHIDRSSQFGKQLYRIYSALYCIRQLFRLITAASGVPVEPDEQSRLLDECKRLPGVVGGGVPGAGGFDALFLLIIETPAVLESVENLWEGWTEMSVCPLLARQSDGGLARVESAGVKGLEERIEKFQRAKKGNGH